MFTNEFYIQISHIHYTEQVDLAVSSIAGVLTARLSATDAAANHIVARVQSYPLIFTGALTTVAVTLGSRYLGERQQQRFLQLGVALLSWSGVLALVCGLGLFFFVHPIYGFFTADAPTLAALEPTAAVLPVYLLSQPVSFSCHSSDSHPRLILMNESSFPSLNCLHCLYSHNIRRAGTSQLHWSTL
jgi:O-antigen/teichoic acid export membrane protein